jgi:hypothetical protein
MMTKSQFVSFVDLKIQHISFCKLYIQIEYNITYLRPDILNAISIKIYETKYVWAFPTVITGVARGPGVMGTLPVVTH